VCSHKRRRASRSAVALSSLRCVQPSKYLWERTNPSTRSSSNFGIRVNSSYSSALTLYLSTVEANRAGRNELHPLGGTS